MISQILKVFCILVVGFLLGYTTANIRNKCRCQTTLTEKTVATTATRNFASEFNVPFTELEGSSLEQAVSYLRAITRTGITDSSGQTPYRLNFIIVDPQNSALPINLRLQSMKLDKLCERIAQSAGVQVQFEEDAIVFTTEK